MPESSGGRRREYVRIDDELTIYAERSGGGQLHVVFVPGWTMTTESFDRQLDHYADSSHVTAVTYDPRGQGRSTITAEGHTYEQHGRDLKRLLDTLGIDAFVLVGWSNGGGDVLEFVRLFGSDGLKGLVLLDTPATACGDRVSSWVWFGTDVKDQASGLQEILYDFVADRAAFNDQFADWMFTHPTAQGRDLVRRMTTCTPTAVAATLNATYLFLDNAPQVRQLDGKVPLLFYTRQETLQVARAWGAHHAPNATVMGHGAHMMFWEDPSPFNAAIDQLMASVELHTGG